MAAFIGNYYQHIMGILLADSNYETICKLYDLGDAVTVESLRKSIARKRGNLPKKITPKEFYTRVIWGLFENEDAIMCFARRLHVILEKDGIFPQEFKKEIDKISGWNSEAFDEGAFSSYLFYLLQKDKEAKKKDADSEPVKKKDVTELMELAEDAEGCADFEGQPDSEQELPLAFSRRFFTKGARELLELGDAAFEQELERLSVVFQHISTLEYSYEPLGFKGGENLIATLKEWVRHCLADSGNREILKVKGPLGSYKNRLMQYLYLAILRSLSCVTPIYIDIASYEKAAEGNEGIDENDFLKAFEEDIAAAEKIVAKSPNKKPLLMLDGVRDFTCRDESLYYSINERLQSMDWYLIVCMDTEFTVNKQNKYEIHPLVSNGFECYLRLRSMNLNRRQESIVFIRNCVDVFKVALPADVTAEQIYENLVRLNFLTLDAYWLTYILHSHLKGILERKNNISGLYTAICVSFLGSHKAMESASEFAYEFEFGKRNFKNANPYFDLRWRLIRKHRSVLDFLIAKFYIKKVSELNLVKGNKEQNVAALSFFNMVLQKSITRFVVAMLTGVDDYERQIMIVAKNHYDDLQLFGKSELTFWMARLQNTMRKKECIKLLQGYNRKELARYKADEFASLEEKRKAAFLLRGINVSLIYENDKRALEYYLGSLLNDKIANSVNRGFHLEYYGDKPYIPNKTLLDFEDDVTVGESTFTVLCLSLDRRRRKAATPVALLEIMTLCTLLQARFEQADNPDVMDVEPYIDKCVRYLEWILQQRIVRGLKDVCDYFYMMRDELRAYKASHKRKGGKVYHPSNVFNKFFKAAEVERAGWVEADLPAPENIVEHMYNCWLIGMLYLPNTHEDAGYSKDRILQMLLIHDLGEAVTGDISRPVKRANQSFYDQQERLVMQSLLLSGTYPNAVDLSQYRALWETWDARTSINAQIAKDIDNIQAIYQFCCYYLQYPDHFTEESLIGWLAGIDELETDVCKEIADNLIVKNPQFEALFEQYQIETDEY